MYGMGNTTPVVLGTTTTSAIVAANVLPSTGMNLAVELALSVAAGLAVWAVVYMLTVKFSKR